MKKCLIILTLPFFILSCSTRYSISDYINDELKKESQKRNVIISKEKVSINRAIDILKGNTLMIINKDVNYSRTMLLNENDYKILSERYSKDTITEYWNSKDFNYKIMSAKKMGNYVINLRLNDYDGIPTNYYFISNPVFFKKKKYLFFYISKGDTNHTNGGVYAKCIILKKIRGNWEVEEEINSNSIN